MKIHLERNLNSGSGKLFRCTVCEGACSRSRLRPLLCRDDGAIVGDICADCLKQPTNYIQQQLHQRAAKSIDRPLVVENSQVPSPQKQALMLSELTHQPLTKPPFYVWWWKRLTIAISESRELEAARTGAASNAQLRIDRSIYLELSAEQRAMIADADSQSFGRDN